MADSRQPGDLISDFDEVLRKIQVLEKLMGSQPEISTPSLSFGWAAQAGFAPPRIYRVYNMITIAGVFNGASASNVQAFFVPSGWAPTDLTADSLSYWNGTVRVAGMVYVYGTGQVNIYGTGDVLVAQQHYVVNMTYSTKT